MYLGDFALGKTFDTKFTTIQSTGAPITLAGSPVVAAYPDNSTTEITAGITLTVDFDSRTGLHNLRVVATSGNGYATATNYALVLTAGTVDGVSVVGYVIAHFSIEARAAIQALTVDTYAQPGQEAPAATTTLALMLRYLYKAWRNKITQTSSSYSLYADNTVTIDQKATVTDDGTTLTRDEIASGP